MNKNQWERVAAKLVLFACNPPHDKKNQPLLDESQRASLAELSKRIRAGQRMVLIADEVGMGKTRIAAALIKAVEHASGRAVVVLPPGLGAQWQAELRLFDPNDTTLLPLRSYESFIAGFATQHDLDRFGKKKRLALNARRLQRELPSKGWSQEKVLMISHSFANMRFPQTEQGDKAQEPWRRMLLRWIRVFCGRASLDRRVEEKSLMQAATVRAAHFIVSGFNQEQRDEIKAEKFNFKKLEANEYKNKLLPYIGKALGEFDLVVIDEAHKSRGEDSSLSRLLGKIIFTPNSALNNAFRLGMTATPVELYADQWIDTLKRLDEAMSYIKIEGLRASIKAYVDVVKRVQTEVLDASLVEDFESKATKFQEALKTFVIRRDKRDDPQFSKYIDRYRNVDVFRVNAARPNANGREGFSHEWLRCLAAAEAISLLPDLQGAVKRKRIELAKGLGLSSLSEVDVLQPDEIYPSMGNLMGTEPDDAVQFWLEAAQVRESTSIYTHPAILAAVKLVESYTAKKQKVLVFGIFIEPLYALTRLLNARAMLRALSSRQHWPASTVAQSDLQAMRAALNHEDVCGNFRTLEMVNCFLKNTYDEWESQRKDQLWLLHKDLEEASDKLPIVKFILDFWRNSGDGSPENNQIGLLLSALEYRRGSAPESGWTAEVFLNDIDALLDELRQDEDEESDGLNKNNATLKTRLVAHLADHSARDGYFARFMFSGTKPQTRRNLQSVFNRSNSRLMVLVSQSQVGREGLNLHEACKTMVLLHSEWNPAVVEQQIGRVDRKNSQWLKDLAEWEKDRIGDMPTINIHPIVFAGTYGEHNWNTLKIRWDAYRAQLHGDILSGASDRPAPPSPELVQRIKHTTPRFSPPPFMKVFLDDERQTPNGWIRVYWPDEAIALLQAGQVTEISLDHDLGDDLRGTGYDVVLWIEEAVRLRGFVPPRIHVHSANLAARARMLDGITAIAQAFETLTSAADGAASAAN